MTTASAAAAMAAPAGFRASGWLFAPRSGKRGKFLVQFGRPAMRAFGPAPVGGPQQDFAVPLAFRTMKLVEWHDSKNIRNPKKFKTAVSIHGGCEITFFVHLTPAITELALWLFSPRAKVPEGWRTPERLARSGSARLARQRFGECGGPPPLSPRNHFLGRFESWIRCHAACLLTFLSCRQHFVPHPAAAGASRHCPRFKGRDVALRRPG